MKELVTSFPAQLKESVTIASSVSLQKEYNMQQVIITGLGGSGISGTIIQNLLKNECRVPILVNKGYQLPAFINENTLVITCSYSGNTEETLSAYHQAAENECQIIGLTSGGKLQAACEKDNRDCILIPGGLPPRAAFGYPFVQLLNVFALLGLSKLDYLTAFSHIAAWLTDNQTEISREAKVMARELHGTLPVLYGEERLDGVIQRFRQQINENAKMLAWHHVVPELNHNEIVGWRSKENRLAVVMVTDGDEFERNTHRLNYLKEVVAEYAGGVHALQAKGETPLQKALYLIHFADWVSVHLAEIKQIDPVEVKVIEELKERLSTL